MYVQRSTGMQDNAAFVCDIRCAIKVAILHTPALRTLEHVTECHVIAFQPSQITYYIYCKLLHFQSLMRQVCIH